MNEIISLLNDAHSEGWQITIRLSNGHLIGPAEVHEMPTQTVILSKRGHEGYEAHTIRCDRIDAVSQWISD